MNVSRTYIIKKRSKKEYVQNDRVLKNDRKKNEVGGWMGFIRHRSFLFRQLAMNRLSYYKNLTTTMGRHLKMMANIHVDETFVIVMKKSIQKRRHSKRKSNKTSNG